MVFKNRLKPLIVAFLFLSGHAYGMPRKRYQTAVKGDAATNLQIDGTSKDREKYNSANYVGNPILFELAKAIELFSTLDTQYKELYENLSNIYIPESLSKKIDMGYLENFDFFAVGQSQSNYISIRYDRYIKLFFIQIHQMLYFLEKYKDLDAINAINDVKHSLIKSHMVRYRESLRNCLHQKQCLYMTIKQILEPMNVTLLDHLNNMDEKKVLALLKDPMNIIEELNSIMFFLKESTHVSIYSHHVRKELELIEYIYPDRIGTKQATGTPEAIKDTTLTQFFSLLKEKLIVIFDRFEEVINRFPKSSDYVEQNSYVHNLFPSSTNPLK